MINQGGSSLREKGKIDSNQLKRQKEGRGDSEMPRDLLVSQQ